MHTKTNRIGTAAAAFALGMGAWGCRETPAPPPPQKTLVPADVPLMSAEQVIVGLRSRYGPVRTLWTRHDFAVSVMDSKGKVHTYDGDGTLQLRKPPVDSPAGTPTELRLKGAKDIVGEVFDLGANRERAWLIMRGDVDAMAWLEQGSDATFDPKEVPVRPDLVAEVLGVGDWCGDLARFPSPVVVFDPETDCYRVTLVERRPAATEGQEKAGGFAARREVFADRQTLMIKRIVFYAPDGRPAVEATLSKWMAVPGTSSAEGRPGYAPADIVLSLPLSRATMRFSLRDVSASRNGFPGDRSFAFPSEPGVSKIRRLDQPKQK